MESVVGYMCTAGCIGDADWPGRLAVVPASSAAFISLLHTDRSVYF